MSLDSLCSASNRSKQPWSSCFLELREWRVHYFEAFVDLLYVLEGSIELVCGVSVVSEVVEHVFDERVDVSLAEETPQEDFLDDVRVGGLGVLPVVAVRLAHEVIEVQVQRGELIVDLLDDLVVACKGFDCSHVPF